MMSVQSVGLALMAAIASDIVFSAPTLPGVHVDDEPAACGSLSQSINNTYPLTKPIILASGSIKYHIAIVSDLDRGSASPSAPNTWHSYFKHGYLTHDPVGDSVSVEWDPPTTGTKKFQSNFSMNGRSLELSELVTYDGQLITVDDKTGLVYIIEDNVLIPWAIIADGDGRQARGFKNEWATVKSSKLYVGTHGRELVSTDGRLTVTSSSGMWVKAIDSSGGITHLNWTENFIKLRAAAGINFPGYMTHESCVWSDVHDRWFFLPRKASLEPYDPKRDERKATNLLLAATSDFGHIQVTRIGQIVPNHGYASFKFIPGTNDTIITAINTMEEKNKTATFITIFTIEGKIIYPETKVSDLKFEGFEFI